MIKFLEALGLIVGYLAFACLIGLLLAQLIRAGKR